VYRWIDHTSEVELELEGATHEDVFREGLRAFAEVLAHDPAGPARRVEVELRARDQATLLADWLEELVFLAESERLLPERVTALTLDGASLRATVEGRAATPRYLVKAVTYHRLALESADGGVRARVTLDV
jgi:SHS2 domain-containing protein